MEASQSADGEEKGGKWERNPTNERGRKGTRIASLKSSLLAINWRCRCDRLWRDLIGLFAGRRSKMLRSLLALKKKKKKKKKKKSSALVKQRMHGVAIKKKEKGRKKEKKNRWQHETVFCRPGIRWAFVNGGVEWGGGEEGLEGERR